MLQSWISPITTIVHGQSVQMRWIFTNSYDPERVNDVSDPQSWRSSLDVGGSPGVSDFVPIESWLKQIQA